MALIPHLFAAHPVPELTAEVDPRNLASLRVLQKLGFAETRRDVHTMQWRDKWCDSVHLALPRLRKPTGSAPNDTQYQKES